MPQPLQHQQRQRRQERRLPLPLPWLPLQRSGRCQPLLGRSPSQLLVLPSAKHLPQGLYHHPSLPPRLPLRLTPPPSLRSTPHPLLLPPLPLPLLPLPRPLRPAPALPLAPWPQELVSRLRPSPLPLHLPFSTHLLCFGQAGLRWHLLCMDTWPLLKPQVGQREGVGQQRWLQWRPQRVEAQG